MDKPKWAELGLKGEGRVLSDLKVQGTKSFPEAHLGHIKSQNVLPKSKEVNEALKG